MINWVPIQQQHVSYQRVWINLIVRSLLLWFVAPLPTGSDHGGEETLVPCWSGWHSTPLGPTSLCVNWMMKFKDTSDFKSLCFDTWTMYWYSLNKHLVPSTSLPTMITTAIQAIASKTNVHKSCSTDSPSKRWWIILTTAMYATVIPTVLELLPWLGSITC